MRSARSLASCESGRIVCADVALHDGCDRLIHQVDEAAFEQGPLGRFDKGDIGSDLDHVASFAWCLHLIFSMGPWIGQEVEMSNLKIRACRAINSGLALDSYAACGRALRYFSDLRWDL